MTTEELKSKQNANGSYVWQGFWANDSGNLHILSFSLYPAFVEEPKGQLECWRPPDKGMSAEVERVSQG